MNVATSSTEVGVRELKNQLSRYLERVRCGETITITDRGRPVATISGLGADARTLSELVDAGLVRPPTTTPRHVPRRIRASGPVSELVAEQRR